MGWRRRGDCRTKVKKIGGLAWRVDGPRQKCLICGFQAKGVRARPRRRCPSAGFAVDLAVVFARLVWNGRCTIAIQRTMAIEWTLAFPRQSFLAEQGLSGPKMIAKTSVPAFEWAARASVELGGLCHRAGLGESGESMTGCCSSLLNCYCRSLRRVVC